MIFQKGAHMFSYPANTHANNGANLDTMIVSWGLRTHMGIA